MGYQALLFCPDEKTARTVTQVLSELEFAIESCAEPFAAVKKLMGQHFDAVVVDCDNEQNATLLFKSARNSTSNQASLAVAVVEGQAGVAKAFRIGANLVLTKPINIEQAKGTLRVARGLLRKSEPAKGAAPGPAIQSPTPVATKPIPSAKPPAPPAPAAFSTPTSVAKPVAPQSWPSPAVAASPVSAAHNQDPPNMGSDDTVAATSPVVPVVPALAEAKSTIQLGLSAVRGSGAASAPAPAREAQDSHLAATFGNNTTDAAAVLEKPTEAISSASPSFAGSAPSFTFGGTNVPNESGGGSKKILLGVAAVVIVAAGIYAGWTRSKGHTSEPVSIQTPPIPAPVEAPQIAKPSAQLSNSPAKALSSPVSPQPVATPAKSRALDDTKSVSEETDHSPEANSTKPSNTDSSANKSAAAAPLMVKGGKAPEAHASPSAPDAPAPSMIGIAAAGGEAPPPNLGDNENSAPKPVLQTLSVSQGVSQGLLLKKVQPVYPKNALFMRTEGSVELMATISKTGDISHVKVLSGDSQLSRAATDAVKQWKYKPYLLNGEPVEIQTQVTINFKLPH